MELVSKYYSKQHKTREAGIVVSVPLAQWLARWTSNPKVPGSNPGWDVVLLFGKKALFFLIIMNV